MSGGSYSYIFAKIESQLCGRMFDTELNDLMEDISNLAYDLELWQSGDRDEEDYRKTVTKFKEKWFNSSREVRLKKYVDEAVKELKTDLYNMIGIKEDKDEQMDKRRRQASANR